MAERRTTFDPRAVALSVAGHGASTARRFSVAVALAAAAALLAAGMADVLGGVFFVFPLGAVALAALHGGLAPGLVTLGTTVALQLLVRDHLGPATDSMRLAIYAPLAASGAVLMALVRRALLEASGGWSPGSVRGLRAADAARARRFLDRASRRLSESIDYERTLAEVARLAVPSFADWCFVVIVDEGGALRRVAVEAADPARAAAARRLLVEYPIDRGAEHGVGRVLRTGRSELLPEVDGDFVLPNEPGGRVRAEILAALGLRSFIAVPLRARGRVLGVIDFGLSHGSRRYAEPDLALAEELARRCAQAIDNARLYREAKEAVAAREELLSLVSHDLKAPLGAVRLGAQAILRRGTGDPELQRPARAIVRSSTRMERLIHDLVDEASVQTGRFAVRTSPWDLADVVGAVLETFDGDAQDRGVGLAFHAPEERLIVSCDRDRIEQVLSNLLANALAATPAAGTIDVAISRRPTDVVVTVSDSGPGIAETDLEHVFEKYWTRQFGTRAAGLGLHIARAIVSAHGGRIWAERREAGGTRMSFTLPLASSAAAAEKPEAEPGSPQSGGSLHQP